MIDSSTTNQVFERVERAGGRKRKIREMNITLSHDSSSSGQTVDEDF